MFKPTLLILAAAVTTVAAAAPLLSDAQTHRPRTHPGAAASSSGNGCPSDLMAEGSRSSSADASGGQPCQTTPRPGSGTVGALQSAAASTASGDSGCSKPPAPTSPVVSAGRTTSSCANPYVPVHPGAASSSSSSAPPPRE